MIVENGPDKIKTEFVVVDTNTKSKLGLNDSIKLKFVTGIKKKEKRHYNKVDVVVDRKIVL